LDELIKEKKVIKSGKYYSIFINDEYKFSGEIIKEGNTGFCIKYTNPKNRIEYLRIKENPDLKLTEGEIVDFKIIFKKNKKDKLAKIISVKEQQKISVTGKFVKSKLFGYVIPDSKLIKKDIYVSNKNQNGAKENDKVVCEILNPGEINYSSSDLEGRISEILGKAGDVSVELLSLFRKFNLTKEFDKKVVSEAEKIVAEIKSTESSDGRLDIRDEVCFTIDPENAKDFDDAVSVKKTSKGFILGVHISDVSHYVRENTELDREAILRGTSVYLFNDVVPMLPEILSTDICSLKPNQDRFAFSIFIELDKKFNVTGYKINKTVINSKRRFTYEEVQNIIDTKKGDFVSEISLMNKIAKKLNAVRLSTGSIDFDTPEVKFEYDKDGSIKNILVKDRLDSMRMIEEFMLLANKCITEYVVNLSKRDKTNYPFIYRVHDIPDEEKLKDLSEFVTQFGYSFDIKNKKTIKTLLDAIKGKPEEYIVNDLLIRSMAKAIYSEKNIGHYGLGFDDYTHFTSPIRRYPDLMVHRMLLNYLDIGNPKTDTVDISLLKQIQKYKKILPDLCKQCSAREQNAVVAERESIKIMQIQYLSKHIGDEYSGIISGIVRYGMFVEILDILIEGMIRFRDIEDDYYEFKESKHIAVGLRKGKIFRAGDKVKIKVINADVETKKTDFILL
jgi:ribonuclease R